MGCHMQASCQQQQLCILCWSTSAAVVVGGVTAHLKGEGQARCKPVLVAYAAQ